MNRPYRMGNGLPRFARNDDWSGGSDEGEVTGVEGFTFMGKAVSFFTQGKPVGSREWHFLER
ncbi:MAG: hypothetical protein UW42_C0058G0005 [Candidatus Collierbacteria bacterium GW2011_GWB1_44_197]|nr:MAG: hypothetical protein UW42_C0058G0005 [Candidatus Collierbacteria bacterium GW2011_GWB1_44_197]KKT64971.1 MAG: hypothetical protein UW58_C0034G0004 [Candidatus Collierbacteria bacterium GW2011_GWC2_44_30]